MQDISELGVAFPLAKQLRAKLTLTKSRLNVRMFLFKRARCLVNEYLTFHVPRETPLGTWRGCEAGPFVTVDQQPCSSAAVELNLLRDNLHFSGNSLFCQRPQDFEVWKWHNHLKNWCLTSWLFWQKYTFYSFFSVFIFFPLVFVNKTSFIATLKSDWSIYFLYVL